MSSKNNKISDAELLKQYKEQVLGMYGNGIYAKMLINSFEAIMKK